jgi:hypothetical protein
MAMEPAYPAARSVAAQLEEYFIRHAREARQRGETDLAPLPDAATIEAVIDTAFWASLRREEGYETRVSLAFLSPDHTAHPLRFEQALALEPAKLTRVAPAVKRPGIHLGVWRNGGDLVVWGTTRVLPPLCFVLEVAGAGVLVIKHHRSEELGKFQNVAVLEADQIKLVDERASGLPDCTEMLAFGSLNILVQLAVSMREHGRGGSLLVVPAGSEAWRESILQPVPYAAVPAFSELAQLLREEPDDPGELAWQESVSRAVDAIAGLTAVDGAAVMTNTHELLGFGAKIMRRRARQPVEEVLVTEPILGGMPARVPPQQLGGTRHLSAAQFVHDQRDSIALVASQDGRFTIFAWSNCEEMVHAHRVETLLL